MLSLLWTLMQAVDYCSWKTSPPTVPVLVHTSTTASCDQGIYFQLEALIMATSFSLTSLSPNGPDHLHADIAYWQCDCLSIMNRIIAYLSVKH